jgi:hypothetical protein
VAVAKVPRRGDVRQATEARRALDPDFDAIESYMAFGYRWNTGRDDSLGSHSCGKQRALAASVETTSASRPALIRTTGTRQATERANQHTTLKKSVRWGRVMSRVSGQSRTDDELSPQRGPNWITAPAGHPHHGAKNGKSDSPRIIGPATFEAIAEPNALPECHRASTQKVHSERAGRAVRAPHGQWKSRGPVQSFSKSTTVPPALSSRGPEVEECDRLAGLARSTLPAKCWCYLLPNGELSRTLPLSVVAALGVASRRRPYLRRQLSGRASIGMEPYDPSGDGAPPCREARNVDCRP